MKDLRILFLYTAILTSAMNATAASGIHNGKALEAHTKQNDLQSMTLDQIRLRGLKVFSTPYTKADGFGDGPAGFTAEERAKIGDRPTINANGTFSRFNGLDAQTCLECHSVISRATIPMTFGIGGAGGINDTAVPDTTFFNINDDENQINSPSSALGTTGQFNINGRAINPPFIFGSGGVELVGNEMTEDLQQLANNLAPNNSVVLKTKGIKFGTLSKDANGNFETANVNGIESDPDSPNFLVVQPFGRKGNNITARTFDLGAMPFHMGMQPDEILYKNTYGESPSAELDGTIEIDGDGDLVSGELLIGDMSVLSVFMATLEPPTKKKLNTSAKQGKALFNDTGCASCHKPHLKTRSKTLGLRYPEIANKPSDNVYMDIDLSAAPTLFPTTRRGGIKVHLFADLKIHDMGPALAEANGDSKFTTARLWGVIDTAPYLHDGRALTIKDAIELHGQPGSEAEDAVEYFFNTLTQNERNNIYDYLKSMRTPKHPAEDLLN